MSALIDPATADLLWTAIMIGGLFGLSIMTLMALPWSDAEIAQMDTAFRSMGEITTERATARSLS